MGPSTPVYDAPVKQKPFAQDFFDPNTPFFHLLTFCGEGEIPDQFSETVCN